MAGGRAPRTRPLGLVLPLALAVSAAGAGTVQELECRVAGYDLVVSNPTEVAIAAPFAVHWTVPFARRQGTATIDAELEPGQAIVLSAVLGSTYLGPNRECTAEME
jgi:hypothetical protein